MSLLDIWFRPLQNLRKGKLFQWMSCLAALSVMVGACAPGVSIPLNVDPTATEAATPYPEITPLPTRPPYDPGQLVDYIAQSGDTLPALAAHFNTSVEEIRAANPIIPQDVTTLPPGFPMRIPIYYLALWGTPYQIIPDGLFVNGPDQIGFDTAAFIAAHEGWLKDYSESIAVGRRTSAEIIDIVADKFSLSPRLLLALIEYQAQGLSRADGIPGSYPLGYREKFHKGLYLQLVWAANELNNGYYGWRRGSLTSFELPEGKIVRPDPWQNAGTVGLQYYFAQVHTSGEYDLAVSSIGLAQTYADLFGDPWAEAHAIIPGSLAQPELSLPFEPGSAWNFTGGPHTGWGKGEPYAAIDFAPSGVSECNATNEWIIAMASGVIARAEPGMLLLDLDGDGSEQTGWVIFYLHLATDNAPAIGKAIGAGERIGHPSCEGGESTGTHVHIARKYNGEWILADGPLGFTLAGWIAHNGDSPYEGTLTRFSRTVIASTRGEAISLIEAEAK
jgi:hypothetical protein